MKIYRVVDDGVVTRTCVDRLAALEELYRLYKKYNDKQEWFHIDEEIV